MTAYPTRDKIEEIFSDRHRPDIFNPYLAQHVDARVIGHEFALSGKYKSKDHFHEGIFDRLTAVLDLETLRVEVNHVVGGGDSAWAAVHTTATALSKSGKPFHHEWVDLVRFNSDGKIAQVKEFFDTKELHTHLDEHESSQTKEKKTDKHESSQTKETKAGK